MKTENIVNNRLERCNTWLKVLEICKNKDKSDFKQLGKIKTVFNNWQNVEKTSDDGHKYNVSPYWIGFENWLNWDTSKPKKYRFSIYYRSAKGSVEQEQFFDIYPETAVKDLKAKISDIIKYENEANQEVENGKAFKEGRQDAVDSSIREIEKRIERMNEYEQKSHFEEQKAGCQSIIEILKNIKI